LRKQIDNVCDIRIREHCFKKDVGIIGFNHNYCCQRTNKDELRNLISGSTTFYKLLSKCRPNCRGAHMPLHTTIVGLSTRRCKLTHSGGARVLTRGGHENFFGGAIFILDSGAEPAKWATEARSPSIGLSE